MPKRDAVYVDDLVRMLEKSKANILTAITEVENDGSLDALVAVSNLAGGLKVIDGLLAGFADRAKKLENSTNSEKA